MTDGLLSVVIPSYNEEGMIEKTFQVIDSLLSSASVPHELLFIDDGSKVAPGKKSIRYP